MNQDVLRRKLQKKKKHKPYRKCLKCGQRMRCKLVQYTVDWQLFKYCGRLVYRNGLVQCLAEYDGCGHFEELFWSGGGIGRHIPHG